MSEAEEVYKEAALWKIAVLSRPAQIVLERKAYLVMVEGILTEQEVYNILLHPAENGAALDEYLKAKAVPKEEELLKWQAAAYLLQKLAYVRADLLEQRRKDFAFKKVL